jgi:hypothetical protein
MPPETIISIDARIAFAPAPELVEWATATFINDDGKLHKPDHLHLQSASIGMLWTNVSKSRIFEFARLEWL